MKQNIILLLDASQSMASVQEDVIKSVNNYFEYLKQDPDTKYVVTIMMFNSGIQEFVYSRTLFDKKGNYQIPVLTTDNYIPEGDCRFYDSVSTFITNIANLSPEKFRENTLVLMLLTEGDTASQKGYKEMVDLIRRTGDKWKFSFLAVNEAALETANKMKKDKVSDSIKVDIGDGIILEEKKTKK